MSLSTILKSDSAGPAVRHLYEKSHILLAGLVPTGLILEQDSKLRLAADVGLATVLPLHSHVSLNYVLADYVPKHLQGAARWGVLGLTAVTFAGLMKLNVTGRGVTQTVKDLWVKEGPAAQA